MSDDPKAGPFSSPFASLGKLRDSLPAGTPPPSATAATTPPKPSGPARAVVRLERKGRRGKEVTVIEQLALKPRELAIWLQQLKSALGCGGAIEGAALVLQGDHRERVCKLLGERGVRKVISG